MGSRSRRTGKVVQRRVANLLTRTTDVKWRSAKDGERQAHAGDCVPETWPPPDWPEVAACPALHIEAKGVTSVRLAHLAKPSALVRQWWQKAWAEAHGRGAEPLMILRISGVGLVAMGHVSSLVTAFGGVYQPSWYVGRLSWLGEHDETGQGASAWQAWEVSCLEGEGAP